jgi:Lrp/AsnC family transcriptional regulator for asnA, asnC and gidA
MARTLDSMIDATDVAILEVLQRDGRTPFSTIARQLDLPESTVRQRCKKILDSGLVSIVATGDPLRWGIPIEAIHLVRIEPLRLEEAAAGITAMPDVRYVGVTLGGTVLIVESLHPSAEELHGFLVQRLPAVAGVKEVVTHQIVENRKSVWDWRAWLSTCMVLPNATHTEPSNHHLPPRGEKETP